MFGSRYAILETIRKLDPVRDDQRIVFLSSCWDFPFDTTRALELALFRTYCVPSISRLLDATGEFAARPQRRYDDTDIIVSELMEHGYDSDRGRRALRRMNRIHSRFEISNGDFLYVLSTFVFEPIRWNARFGWRPMCEPERLAHFHFWRGVGLRMNIRGIPEEYAEFEAFSRDYEREHFAYSDANRRIGEATRELFASWFPRPFAPVVRASVYALIDEPMRRAFGFPEPSGFMRGLLVGSMGARRRFLRLMPPRRGPRMRTELARRSRPVDYVIEELGPPEPPAD